MGAMLKTFVLRDDMNAKQLWAFLKANWRAMADQGKPLAITVAPHKQKRSTDQNAKLHAMIADLAAHAWIDGRQYDEETWKEYIRCKFIGTEEVDLPDGRRTMRGLPTSSLSVEEFANLITQVQAWAASELGIELI